MTSSAFRNALAAANANKHAFAAWVLPQQHVLHYLSCEKPRAFNATLLENSVDGFVLAPFAGTVHRAYLLEGKVHSENLPAGSENTETGDTDLLQDTSTKHYTHIVAEAVAHIRAGGMQKVVLARKKTMDLPEDFDPAEFLVKLHASYPGAFCYLAMLPDTGTWMGATPETLLQINPQELYTVALAGTQSPAQKNWGGKEKDEQAFVTSYIWELLKAAGADNIEMSPTGTLQAGHLSHLVTGIRFSSSKKPPYTLASGLLPQLHPTPAVGGTPKETAVQFISDREGFDRKYYSGYLGPLNTSGSSAFYVNLRCMEIVADKAVLYAGAGITKDSDPEKELFETERKMAVLGNLLRA